MNIKKTVVYLLVFSLLIIPLSACGSSEKFVNVKPKDILSVSSAVVDENDNYILEWNEEKKAILLKDKQTSHIWSTVPYDFFLQDDTNVNMSSPLFINYYNPSDGSLMTAKAFADCIELDNLSVKTEYGKIILEFYFEDAEILIPLTVSLENNCLKATIDAGKIKESGKNRLIDVSVLPYFCSAVNTTEKTSYLFLPVGSGALMYLDEDVQNSSRIYSGEIYGSDAARYILDDNFEEEAVRLPVFGVKAEDNALFAIIEQGAESAKISGEAGNTRNNHSTAYATFNIRGYDETEVERTDFSDAYIYSEEFDTTAVYTVAYYPLTGENANYNGMAKLYKSYLAEKELLTGTNVEQKPYLLSFLGGSLVRDVFMGVPYKRIQTATTFGDVMDIVEELSASLDVQPAILLKGFQKKGLDVASLAGGFNFSSDMGGKSGYSELKEFCDKNSIPLFTEYDLVRFSKSADGFNTTFDTAQTAGKQLASFYPMKKNIRAADESFSKISLLQRSKLEKAVDKLLNKADYVSGISLTTLSSIIYSDYSDMAYYSKGRMEEQVVSLINMVKKAKHSVNAGSANGYAAGIIDSITDTPLNNGGYQVLDESIPFYQMVFHGYTAMYSSPLNLSENYGKDLLSAIEGGVSPSFVLTEKTDNSLADTLSNEYYASLFDGNKANIVKTVNAVKGYFELVEGKEILSHRILSDGASETTFTDNVKVIVNHTENDITVETEVIPAFSFKTVNGSDSEICRLAGGK